MTTGTLLILDHAIAVLTVIAWFAAAGTAATRSKPAFLLLVVALVVTAVRMVAIVPLAGRGWWFVEEKVLFGLPILGVAAVAAAVLAGPRLRAVARSRETTRSGDTTAGVVALFAAAFAALVSFVVAFVIGYPLTLPTALIAVAALVAATMLTARVLTNPEENKPESEERAPTAAELNRRRFLGVAGGVVAVGAAGTGIGLALTSGASTTQGGGPGPASVPTISIADLRGLQDPAPGGVVRTQLVTARKAMVKLESGREIDALTFDGTLPGPPITATQGDVIEVRLRNQDIDDGVTLHWHGYDVPCSQDGAEGLTQDTVRPGGEFVYRFRADQVGTYWYHTHHSSHVNVRRGLYGTLIVKPREEDDRGALDLPLAVHTFDDGATVISGGGEHVAAPGTKVRLRLINTDSDPHRFALSGTPFTLVAVDGRDLNGPGEISEQILRLVAGGRYDVVFTMPAEPVVLSLDEGKATVWVSPRGGRRDDTAAGPDTRAWPELDLLAYGTPAPVALRHETANRNFTLVLGRGLAMVDGSPSYAQTVNGLGHPSIPDQLVAEGDTVRFTVVNRSLETHPWHLHGHPVLVLSRDGVPASGSPLWVDTFDVRPGEVWEVAFKAGNPGIWMNHCHNLPHVDQGMMLRLRYDGVVSPFGGGHSGHHD
ncbi:Multicopper oxidase with three cupredoxin domains (includes cell division protein FtsP and spore coat protein CotA) [Actinokineospora alba]|uniref:Multicopper oxidase with three cupredoxin domains (Includes cell division protein FtsP and spore coat protein CotA) n=1 Tax=Actinokineospora alba TaxID=504798 RepID=A0A1H0FXN5_9PSEU|nr:multicopper oxidase family protein [Actinokineospora alba]TDP69664.1 FtsP/CotA-like multicopper oxidase with cupredoxin domain [Actinokineospora alba]SDI11719.1 Multicopper oxidase with three cupredoxin domains (includes cell division protein FtsP and spore coat protein CotA) [Actinokineospora alba]SDN99249.1 Multicopper oxidase with three cupredoxin domains (includes cell division protein FtsP and spore coat protein CotA) [Actinokineospora alba]